MGHLWILIWIKVHNNQNTFTCLEFKNFTIFDQKTMFEKFFWKGKNNKKPQQDSNS